MDVPVSTDMLKRTFHRKWVQEQVKEEATEVLEMYGDSLAGISLQSAFMLMANCKMTAVFLRCPYPYPHLPLHL